MNYPYISRPSTDRDSALSNIIENEVEDLNMGVGAMIIVGMFFDNTTPKKWTLHIDRKESKSIVVDSYHPIEDPKYYSDTFARFSVMESD